MRHQGAKFWPIECDDRYRDILQAHYITSAIYGWPPRAMVHKFTFRVFICLVVSIEFVNSDFLSGDDVVRLI